eukprot:g274.t1
MSLRRHVRLRREYLYRKSLEGKERVAFEKKAAIREALREGKAIPTELYHEEASLRHDIELEDKETAVQKTHVDDEYAYAGVKDSKVCVSTSRDPSSRLRQFVKEMRLIFPNCQRINRGNHKLSELVEACRSNNFTDLVLFQEHRGEPVGMIVCHLPYGPTAHFSISNAVMRHDVGEKIPVSEAFPHLIFEGFESTLGKRIGSILKYLFPVPKVDSKRIITFANDNDFISFRHHTYAKSGPTKADVELKEVGPRFELRPHRIRLGTVDQLEAETEWALRPYMNTAKKKRNL